MSECFLCGNDEGHYLGCAAAVLPGLTREAAYELGLIGPPKKIKSYAPDEVEILRPGSMTTVPEEDVPAEPGETVGQCEFVGCGNPKKSAHARAKWCETHSDPKNRKE